MKIILDLCGGTGSWSRPYVEAGYNVIVATMPHYDVTKIEVSEETLFLPGGGRSHKYISSNQRCLRYFGRSSMYPILDSPENRKIAGRFWGSYEDSRSLRACH